MQKKLLVSEIFESLQGEGRFAGHPALFIRLSGCTRKCKFCDTKYHQAGKDMDIEEVEMIINKSPYELVVWTGGEPLLQIEEITEVIKSTREKKHHLETNADIYHDLRLFNYIAFSPKDNVALGRAIFMRNMQLLGGRSDIKIVTDLKLNKNMIEVATMLMPLTTYNEKKDLEIKRKVFEACLKLNIRYSPRIHVDLFKKKRKR